MLASQKLTADPINEKTISIKHLFVEDEENFLNMNCIVPNHGQKVKTISLARFFFGLHFLRQSFYLVVAHCYMFAGVGLDLCSIQRHMSA